MTATSLPKKSCIVCGRPVKRRTYDVGVEPISQRTAYQGSAQIVADIASKADCQRHTNQPYIVSTVRGPDGWIIRFTVWDGVSYFHRGYFCTGNCAQAQGYASAEHGERYVWKRGE